jgi:ABC-type lipoprotein export system ATPase subunit
METLLELKNLTKTYQSRGNQISYPIFSNLNLKVIRGNTLAIVGPSGSGKSTLLNLIAGLDQATSGEVAIDGRSITAFSEDEAARFRNLSLGFIFQSHHLLPSLNAVENIMIPTLAGHIDIRDEQLKNRAYHLLGEVGLSNRANHLPSQLSGGERQRIAVARALVNEPSLLLADEPTGSLDQNNAESLIDLMIHLSEENKTTLVVVTHSLSIASRMDEAWTLTGGELVKKEI